MFRSLDKQWLHKFVLQITVLNDREFSIAKQKLNSIQELARRKPLVYTVNRSQICWQKCLNFFIRMDTIGNEFLIRNMVLGPVTTPATHILLAHVNLSPGLNTHQGLKIRYITHKQGELQIVNVEHYVFTCQSNGLRRLKFGVRAWAI